MSQREPSAPSSMESTDSSGLVGFGLSVLVLAVFALAVIAGLSSESEAASPRTYTCAARIDCGKPSLPSVQDLPSERQPTVVAPDSGMAEASCLRRYFPAYSRLAQSLDLARSGTAPLALFSSSRGDGRHVAAARSPRIREILAADTLRPTKGCKVLPEAIATAKR